MTVCAIDISYNIANNSNMYLLEGYLSSPNPHTSYTWPICT